MSLPPRALIVHRATELEELLIHHGTRGAVEFFLRTRGRTLADVQARHDTIKETIREVGSAFPSDWRRGRVERADLSRFVFEPDDLIFVVGQDGLVANVAKYLAGQPVFGVNPEPEINPGVLVPLRPQMVSESIQAFSRNVLSVDSRTMVELATDDGQELLALNEIYVGDRGHQSSRYRLIAPDGREERHSSSGVIVSSGTGATGWCRSIHLERRSRIDLPAPGDPQLAWFVREAWPSPASGTALTEGVLAELQELRIMSQGENLVAFGDGLESDRVSIAWGQSVDVRVATRRLNLVVPCGAASRGRNHRSAA